MVNPTTNISRFFGLDQKIQIAVMQAVIVGIATAAILQFAEHYCGKSGAAAATLALFAFTTFTQKYLKKNDLVYSFLQIFKLAAIFAATFNLTKTTIKFRDLGGWNDGILKGLKSSNPFPATAINSALLTIASAIALSRPPKGKG